VSTVFSWCILTGWLSAATSTYCASSHVVQGTDVMLASTGISKLMRRPCMWSSRVHFCLGPARAGAGAVLAAGGSRAHAEAVAGAGGAAGCSRGGPGAGPDAGGGLCAAHAATAGPALLDVKTGFRRPVWGEPPKLAGVAAMQPSCLSATLSNEVSSAY
jgi:hypothetical protein